MNFLINLLILDIMIHLILLYLKYISPKIRNKVKQFKNKK